MHIYSIHCYLFLSSLIQIYFYCVYYVGPYKACFSNICMCLCIYFSFVYIYIYISLCSLAPVSSTHSLPMLSAPNSDISLYVNDHSSLLISKFQCPFLWFSLYPLPLLKVTSHLLEFIYCITNFLFKISTAITVVSLSS